MGQLYLEDLSIGDTFESAEFEMTPEAIIAFARDFDPQPFHTDPEAAKGTFFGALAASGWHTAAMTMRLLTDALPLANGVIGSGGVLSWPSPTYGGDIIRVVATIEKIVPSRTKPGRARIVVYCRTLDRNGQVKQEFRPDLMVWKRGVDPQG